MALFLQLFAQMVHILTLAELQTNDLSCRFPLVEERLNCERLYIGDGGGEFFQ